MLHLLTTIYCTALVHIDMTERFCQLELFLTRGCFIFIPFLFEVCLLCIKMVTLRLRRILYVEKLIILCLFILCVQ